MTMNVSAIRSAIACLILTAAPGSARAVVAPFTNGSFESPVLPAESYLILTGGSTTIDGWVIEGSGLVGFVNGSSASLGVPPADGAQHLGFNGGDLPPDNSISQTFATVAGTTYAVSFNVGRIGFGAGTLKFTVEVVSDAGAQLKSFEALAPDVPGYGSLQTFKFKASTAVTTLTFRDTSLETIATDLLLDNVSVTESLPDVPHPFMNGSFESPVLPADSYLILTGGSTAIDGWVIYGSGLVGFVNGASASLGIPPADGAQHVGFNGGDLPPGNSIAQTFTTVAGTTYAVSFNLGRIGFGDGILKFTVSAETDTGLPLKSYEALAPPAPGYGPLQTFKFTAASDQTTLTFHDTSLATIATDMLLDNVSVVVSTPDGPHPFINGSFESPVLPADSYLILTDGSTVIDGWLIEGPGLVGFVNGSAASLGVPPADGAQHIGFNGGDLPPSNRISQTFLTTPHRSYEVNFNVGRIGYGGGVLKFTVEVLSDTGDSLAAYTAPAPDAAGYGRRQGFTFKARTGTSTLRFTDTSEVTVATDLLLDNVSVKPKQDKD